MLWYELANADEVKKILEQVLYTYDMAPFIYTQDRLTHELVRMYKFNYEIAEALWAEHSSELFN